MSLNHTFEQSHPVCASLQICDNLRQSGMTDVAYSRARGVVMKTMIATVALMLHDGSAGGASASSPDR